jgi:Tol biopolymer transport system component/tRNA A-37 threonylcarbamoyl transferase component Bud32
MPLTSGTRLGPYEITSPLGAGGMGEVYRARDSRLGRDVAIKVLPQHLSTSSEVRARFEREAKAISSLNHPHICTLFDVGREHDTDYLVMELIEGETLAHRLSKGALATAEVLRLGGQIADALDRAHRAGVIHRDLKPGNVMLTKSGAKLMDFGLARAAGMAGHASGSGVTVAALTQSPTVVQPLTAEGTIVGTFQYMAPEQLEGKEADARSDLWALGCVLYEMVTGRRAFDGQSQASLISSIMKDEPRPIAEIMPMSPPALDRLVRACLVKDAEERLQTAHDVKLQLQWIAEAGSQAGVPVPVAARRKNRERIAWALAAVALIATFGLAWFALGSRTKEPDAIQAIVEPPPGAPLTPYSCDVAISPDGRAIAFVAGDSTGQTSLWVRPLGSDVAMRIPDTRSAQWPFWSPDGRYVAFFDLRGGKLMKVAVAGGSPTTICDARNGRGGSWNRDGTIVFAPATEGPLMRVAAGGGEPSAVAALDSARHESAHRFPCFLPDGEHFLFAVLPGRPNGWDIYVGSLRSRAVKRVLTARSAPVHVEPGFLLFERDGRVMAQRFDPRRLELEGDPMAIADAPEPSDLDAEPVASASRNGRLVVLRSVPPDTRLELIDRTGATIARHELPPAPWAVARAAPDGRRAAVLNGNDIWIVDLVRSVPMRFASTSASQPTAVWSPDGNRIAFVSKHAGREEIHIAGLDGRADPAPTTEDAFKLVWDWARDGRFVVFGGLSPETGWDLWLLPLEGDRKPVPYLRGASWETGARVSPDGRWLAYDSNETGQAEIYVQSFPQPGRKVRVSPDGGNTPEWAHSGKELLYYRGGTVIAVPVAPGEDFRPGTPRPLFTIPGGTTAADVVADGDRFLVSVATEVQARDIRLILNWQALLKR